MRDPRPAGLGNTGVQPLLDTLDGIKRNVKQLAGFSGADYVRAVERIESLIAGLPTQVADIAAAYLTANTYTRSQVDSAIASPGDISPHTVNASGNVNASAVNASGITGVSVEASSSLTSSGSLAAAGPVKFPNAFNTDITWTRVSGWIGDDGRLGYASSMRSKKFHIDEATFDPDAFKLLRVVHFQYRAERAKNRADPTYHVATNIGMYAEELDAAGYWEYVIYQFDEDDVERAHPKPAGIHYELLGLLAIEGVQHILDRLDAAGIA